MERVLRDRRDEGVVDRLRLRNIVRTRKEKDDDEDGRGESKCDEEEIKR